MVRGTSTRGDGRGNGSQQRLWQTEKHRTQTGQRENMGSACLHLCDAQCLFLFLGRKHCSQLRLQVEHFGSPRVH